MPETVHDRPMPRRPQTGLMAWQATMGYLRTQYDLDTRLTIQASAQGEDVMWSASAIWGQNGEKIEQSPTLAGALRTLWLEIDRKHLLFASREALVRRPIQYADHEWLDEKTSTLLDRVLRLLPQAAGKQWEFIIVYEPVEQALKRFTVTALAVAWQEPVRVQQMTLEDALRELMWHLARRVINAPG